MAVAVAGCGGSDASNPRQPLSAAAERGRQVAADNGCGTCHTIDGSRSTGPTWEGLAGAEVDVEGGGHVIADETYLRKAIIDPRVETVAGYANIMPLYPDLSTGAVDDLVAYLQALSNGR